jgi:hypothetical protein
VNSAVLLDTQVKKALRVLAAQTPNGYNALDTLGDDLLMRVLAHPDDVKVVWITNHAIDLPEVDTLGYGIYDQTWTQRYRVIVDIDNPDDNLTVLGTTRTMQFGRDFLDLAFMLDRRHGDVFYVVYTSGAKPPRVIMCLVIDPASGTAS